MSIRKFEAVLSPASLKQMAKDLRTYAAELRLDAVEISHKLSEVAADEARAHFSPNVTVTAGENGVIAVGQSVVFEEFGAGARISDPYPGGADVDFEIRRGAYSDLYGGEYAQSEYQEWHHDGETYEYITPVNGLFHGMMAAMDSAPEIAKEVLEKNG